MCLFLCFASRYFQSIMNRGEKNATDGCTEGDEDNDNILAIGLLNQN